MATEAAVMAGEMAGQTSKLVRREDGGDPEENLRIKNLMGYVDGQTTNPSLIVV